MTDIKLKEDATLVGVDGREDARPDVKLGKLVDLGATWVLVGLTMPLEMEHFHYPGEEHIVVLDEN